MYSLYGESYIIDILFSYFKFVMHSNLLLWVGMLLSRAGMFPRKEGGIQVLAGLAPSSLIVGSLYRTP
jgi:hypothetical protein